MSGGRAVAPGRKRGKGPKDATHEGKVIFGHAHQRFCQHSHGRVEVKPSRVELEPEDVCERCELGWAAVALM